MSDTLLVTSNVILWLLVLFLFVVVLLIYKQVGELILARGSAPRHDDQGPAVGEVAPPLTGFEFPSGRPIERRPRNELLVFGFPGCGGCEQIAETLPVLAEHRPETRVTYLGVYSQRDLEEAVGGVAGVGHVVLPAPLQRHEARVGVGVIVAPVAGEQSPHNQYGVTATPFGLWVDAEGVVSAKTMLRSAEDLPRLLPPRANDEIEHVDRMELDVVEVGRDRAPNDGL